jgi:hypothetical protein
MGQNAIKTTREGYDVFTADEKYFTIDSTKNQLKQYLEGSGATTVIKPGFYDTGRTIIEVTHSLGYQPFVLVWFNIDGEDIWTKTSGTREVEVGESSVYITGAIGRPNNNILQICLYTEMFGPEAEIDINYNYIIYIDPYKDAWTQS